ncbi:MAG: mannose-1-phosphate guanylyltransferase [Myxococcales bacterium]|nr:mannose-1-phosphate guanylyltransferase [Myxococcales bacterium]
MGEVFTVIMAGGSGTRFWPQSRRARPKQFLPLGADGTTPLLTATARRVSGLSPRHRTLVVTRADLAAATASALPDLPAENVLLEPVGRNTAPCVAWATAVIQRRDPEAVVVVLAADAFIVDEGAFVAALKTAVEVARAGSIVTLGIKPTRPETGYGYLRVGDAVEGAAAGVKKVAAFVEKPDAARAAQFVAGGSHLWNAGIFVFRADVMRDAVKALLPTVAEAIDGFDAAAREGREAETVAAKYAQLPNISIDYGVMEKVAEVAVVPVDCGWNDVGSWQASWELGAKDAAGNVVRVDRGNAILADASGNVVVAPAGKVVALVGVKDFVVVDTPDALLVMPRDKAQDIKKAIDALTAAKRDDVL